MKKNIIKNIVLFSVGFCLYITIECCFRGFSYPLMGCCGGLCVVILDKINDEISWDVDLFFQSLIGGMIVTIMELVIGMIAKYTHLLPVMWDYSDIPFNFNGIICLPFFIAWLLLSIVAIFVADSINYYVFEDTIVPYYVLFGGKYKIVFYEKECGRNNGDKNE